MDLWTEEFELVDRCQIYKFEDEHEDNLIDTQILDSFAPREEPSCIPVDHNGACWEVESVMDDHIRIAVEFAARHNVIGAVKEKIDDVSATGFVEQNEK